MASRKLAAVLGAILHLCLCQNTPEVKPEFLAPLENHTVALGRDTSFTCVVNHLQNYKVAWIKADSRAILAIHTHMVAHNPRLSVTHNGHNTWRLRVSNVQQNDSGTYMCQVNTDPMRSQNGYMEVVVPPDIKDGDSNTDDLVTNEGGTIKLRCHATGTPTPSVSWRREDGKDIILRQDGLKLATKSYEGALLELIGVQRHDMGWYLCVASNGVPPIVSKRYSVQVHFQPLIKVTNQLVAAPIHSDVILQCYVEASPHAMNTWFRESGEKLLPNDKYMMAETTLSTYSWQMNLTVHSLVKNDFGSYICSAANALGKNEGVVRLQELHLLPQTTPVSFTKNADPRPKKKYQKPKKHNRRPNDGHLEEEEIVFWNNENFATTQRMGGSTQDIHRTERPLTVPSLPSPWTPPLNAASRKRFFSLKNLVLLLLLIMITL